MFPQWYQVQVLDDGAWRTVQQCATIDLATDAMSDYPEFVSRRVLDEAGHKIAFANTYNTPKFKGGWRGL